MKKIVSILLAVLLMMSALPVTALAATKYTVYISSTGSGTMNLRAGPGKDYDVKGYVHHGDKVTRLDVDGIWSKVKTSSGKTGWIKTMYIDGTTKDLGTGYKYIDADGNSVNVRTGAGTGYAAKGKAYDGAKVKVLNTEGSWARITVQSSGLTGWVMTKYLSDNSSGGSGGGGSTSSTYNVYHVTSSTLNVRSGAGTGYSTKATLYKNRAFKVTGSSGNWYKIQTFSGVTGWVSKTYSASGATATVTAGSLNMRVKASASAGIVRTLSYGAKVSVSSVTGNWAKVTYGGTTGYVSLNYLNI